MTAHIKPEDLSNHALCFWFAYFLTPRNTLRFGGDGSEMEISSEGRAALNELLASGHARFVPADDSIPNREHYGATEGCLREVIKSRSGDSPFDWVKQHNFTIFQRKEARDV